MGATLEPGILFHQLFFLPGIFDLHSPSATIFFNQPYLEFNFLIPCTTKCLVSSSYLFTSLLISAAFFLTSPLKLCSWLWLMAWSLSDYLFIMDMPSVTFHTLALSFSHCPFSVSTDPLSTFFLPEYSYFPRFWHLPPFKPPSPKENPFHPWLQTSPLKISNWITSLDVPSKLFPMV